MKSKLLRILVVLAVVAALATSVIAPVAAMTTPTLGVGVTTISTATPYTVTFTTGLDLPANAAGIVVTFDTGIQVAAGTTATIQTSGGLGTAPYGSQAITVASVVGQVVTLNTGSINNSVPDGGHIGAGAIVQLVFTGITNPATIGNFGVTVKTNTETTAVASNQITTTVPPPPVLPGVASVYTAGGVLFNAYNDFATALSTAQGLGDGVTIKLSAGTFTTNFVGDTKSVSILGQGTTAGDVILKVTTGAWTLSGATVVIDKVTIDSTNFTLNLNASTSGTISNSVLKGGPVTLGGAANVIDTCTVNVADAAVSGIVASTATTVKNSTFSLVGIGTGITATGKLTVTGSTFTGTTKVTGNGLAVTVSGANTDSITTSKFTGLTTALTVGAGTPTVTFDSNTVDTCGLTAVVGSDTIMITSATAVSITNNTITNSLDYIINVAANDNLVNVMYNNFKGNVKIALDAANAVVGTPLNMTHNFWNGSNPASVTTAPLISFANPLAVASTGGALTTAATLDATTVAGVNIVSTTGGPTLLGASALGANPAVALPTTVTLKRYFDVFGMGAGLTAATVRFFGTSAAPVAATDTVYFYNSTNGTWVPATASTNPFGGYVEVSIGGASATTIAQFAGTPFALVTVNPVAPPVIVPGSASVPDQAAVGVDVLTPFQWAAVPGADHYDFVLAEDLGTTNKFDIIDYSLTTPVNGAPSKETLKYNTTYWWRVRSVSAAGVASAWTNYFFTTEMAPVVTTPPPVVTPTTVVTSVVITQTQPPAVTTVVTTTGLTITNTQTTTEAIPSYLLWAVIAVGAILVISVIVLIVRTRKI